jgi:hypothetical protein
MPPRGRLAIACDVLRPCCERQLPEEIPLGPKAGTTFALTTASIGALSQRHAAANPGIAEALSTQEI